MFLGIEITSGHIISAVLGALFALIVERMVTGSKSGVAYTIDRRLHNDKPDESKRSLKSGRLKSGIP